MSLMVNEFGNAKYIHNTHLFTPEETKEMDGDASQEKEEPEGEEGWQNLYNTQNACHCIAL